MNLFDAKCEAEDSGLNFVCPCTWFGVFGSKCLKYPKTGIIQHSDGLYTWSRPD